MEAALEQSGGTRPYVKVQTTGPISFGLTIVDENKRAIYYNDEFNDVIVKALAMKCRWQIRKFRKFAQAVICFIDEPILSAFGSSTYVSVTRDDVVAKLGEVVEAVHAEGALAGVHCCGNTEWSILIDAGVDIRSCPGHQSRERKHKSPCDLHVHFRAGLEGLPHDDGREARTRRSRSRCRRGRHHRSQLWQWDRQHDRNHEADARRGAGDADPDSCQRRRSRGRERQDGLQGDTGVYGLSRN